MISKIRPFEKLGKQRLGYRLWRASASKNFLGPSWRWVVRPDTIDLVKARSRPLGKYILAVATIAVCPLGGLGAIGHGTLASVGLVGILAFAVAVYIGLRHPLWL